MRRGRFVIAWVLMVAIVLTNVNYVKADTSSDIIASGNWRGMDWVIDGDGLLTVSGEYAYEGNEKENPPWLAYANPSNGYTSSIRRARITPYGVKSTYRWFYGCLYLTEIDLRNFDTSSVTDMSYMFDGCSVRNIDVSYFDTANVTNMDSMFAQCLFTSLDISNFNTSNVTDMGYMFGRCSDLTSLNISGFDTSNVIDMSYMFCGCSSLKSLDVGGFDTSNVTSMRCMFHGCNSLESLDVSGFDTSNVTSMGYMFHYCSSLTSLDVSGFDTYVKRGGHVTILQSMFSGCRGLISIDLSNFYISDISEVADGILEMCDGLRQLKVPSNISVSVNLPKTMYDGAGNEYTVFPTGLSESIWLYAENPAVVPEGQFRIYVIDYATNEPIPNAHIFVDDTDYDSAENGYITLSADPQDSAEHTIYASADGYIQKPYQQLQIKGGESYTFYLDKMVSADAPEIGEFDMTSDQAIIAEVKKYTSDELYAQWMVIMNSGLSTEDKLKRLNELAHNNGLTDVREGIKYVSTIGSHRRDYLLLTTNECYCAFNWWDWLNTTPKGKTARGLLYADGLLFNNELNKYLDFSTYVKEDYPEVSKCKAMLKEFMEVDKDKSWVSESSSNSQKIMKNMKNAAKLNGIIENAEADEILDKMVKAKTNAEFEKYQNQFCKLLLREARTNQKVEADGKVELYLGCSGLSKALKYASPALSFITSSADDIIGVMSLETDAEIYEEYDDFLTAIYSDTDVSVPMRIAAYQLHDEIENGWENKMLSTLTNCMSFEKDLICLNASSTAFSEATATISLASFVSNIVVDTGDFVKQAAYTSSYAELSALYSLKLQEDRTAFKENPTADNAWQFYEDYNLLWRLRYKGEEQYLRMNEVKAFIFGKLKSVTYSYKEGVVNDTLDLLSTSKFELADSITVPESLQYLKKTVVECPVDVAVYAKDGTLIAELKDGQLSETVNEYGRFAVVYESYSGEYAKVICQSTNDDLDIRITSVSDGLVDYKCADQNEDAVQTFDHLLVEKGDVISVADDQYVLVHSDGSKETQNTLVPIGEDYQKVESLVIKDTTAELPVGQEKAVEVTVLPNNATSKNVIWYSEDEEIAKVKNGVITGIAPGNTVIWVCSSDNAEVFESIDINILEAIARKLGDINGDGEVNAKDRMYLARALAGWDGYTVPGIELADFNGDGEVNAKDRMYLARKLAGWDGYQ